MEIHEHKSELGQWRVAQRSAHPRLRAFVRGYLASTSLLPHPVCERHLPSTEIPLVLNFGAPHRRIDATEPHAWICQDGVWIVGLQDRHQRNEAVGERDFMVVRFTPLGAHHFLRAPMHLIRGQTVELNALDSKLAGLIMSRVGAAGSWADRFDAMEALIAERVAQAARPGGLALAWHRLEAADGRIPLGSLASEIDCSHRALIAQFRTGIGVTPKAAGRLLRFNRVIRSLNDLSLNRVGEASGKPYIESHAPDGLRARAVGWADIAADCGYFDQSHFIKEFTRFSGATPSDFARQMSDVR
jgi:AraC-like DNA-binding protein